jgi:hypothetical protein
MHGVFVMTEREECLVGVIADAVATIRFANPRGNRRAEQRYTASIAELGYAVGIILGYAGMDPATTAAVGERGFRLGEQKAAASG